jgi:hypothetical protein
MSADNIDDNDDDQTIFSFALIDDECWKLVAQFAAPPDGKFSA